MIKPSQPLCSNSDNIFISAGHRIPAELAKGSDQSTSGAASQISHDADHMRDYGANQNHFEWMLIKRIHPAQLP
jgi:hypothetical protein